MPTRRHSSVYLDKRSLELLQEAEEAGLDVNLSLIVREALPGALAEALDARERGRGKVNARKRLRRRLSASPEPVEDGGGA